MKKTAGLRIVGIGALAGMVIGVGAAGPPAHFLVANDDLATVYPPSTISFYDIAADGSLSLAGHVATGGNGIAGGFFGISRLLFTARGSTTCIFAANAQSESIGGIDAATREPSGPFHGSHADNKLARNGIGLAASASHLYATFSGSGNVGVFAIEPGCQLRFAGDFRARGLANGFAEGIAIHGNVMVATYGDGSIESFDISAGMPLSRGDAQLVARAQTDFVPDAVDVTSDGRFAIFGGGSTAAAVEVSNMSSGKLAPPTHYELGTAWNSGSVRLSPDERFLYLSNNSGGRLTAAFFDKATGRVRPGCTSAPLRGYYSRFTYIGAVATELPSGTGGLLYVPELGTRKKSYVATLRFTASENGCRLTEAPNSPFPGGPDSAWLSIGVFPPRPF